jgi:hypothetical protein
MNPFKKLLKWLVAAGLGELQKEIDSKRGPTPPPTRPIEPPPTGDDTQPWKPPQPPPTILP